MGLGDGIIGGREIWQRLLAIEERASLEEMKMVFVWEID